MSETTVQWSAKPPEANGWYWYLAKPNGVAVILQVFAVADGGYHVRIGGGELSISVGSLPGYWYGPLTAPYFGA